MNGKRNVGLSCEIVVKLFLLYYGSVMYFVMLMMNAVFTCYTMLLSHILFDGSLNISVSTAD